MVALIDIRVVSGNGIHYRGQSEKKAIEAAKKKDKENIQNLIFHANIRIFKIDKSVRYELVGWRGMKWCELYGEEKRDNSFYNGT